MKKSYKKRGPVRAKKVTYDGIKFQSGLEVYMYKALKEARIVGEYEPTSYTLLNGFDLESVCFEKQANGKGEYKDRGCKKILPIKYKPDFVGRDFIIECKGRANESFPLRWKLFKAWITRHSPGIALFKPQNQKDCDETIKQIEIMRKNLRTNAKKKQTSL
jgi:hypothetical protein|tara:strand:- start:331 stop:813 length:483 start_codon:yes stop_codon:yes gene_type:complete